MQAIIIMCVIGAVLVWAWLVTDYYMDNAKTSTKTNCTGDCNQGRNCDCVDQEKLRLEDEFNNSNWPFPVNKP